jgi:hypothetical protein
MVFMKLLPERFAQVIPGKRPARKPLAPIRSCGRAVSAPNLSEPDPAGDRRVIRHAALFRLSHPAGSPQEAGFLAALAALSAIPGVADFEIARETSPKNAFAFAVSMRFADQAAYDAYNAHPLHVAFVRDRWAREVAAFMEHDTVALPTG